MEKVVNEIIEAQLKQVEASERMKECLELRLNLLGTNHSAKNEYEKNEAEILKMKTEAQIEQLKVVIEERKQIFQESFGRYVEELEFEEKAIA